MAWQEFLGRRATRVFQLPDGPTQASLSFWAPPELPWTREVCSPDFVVLYLLSGNGSYESASRTIPLTPGTFLLRFPQERHILRREAGQPWVEFALRLNGSLVDLLRKLGIVNPTQVVFHPGMEEGTGERLNQFLELMRRTPDWDVGLILLEIQRFLLDARLRERLGTQSTAQEEALHLSCTLLASDLAGQIPLPEVARKVGLGYHLFRKRFTLQMGISPQEYRVRRRVERAQELLLEGRLSCSAISEQLGYTDLSAFHRQFRRVTGQTPAAYRDQK